MKRFVVLVMLALIAFAAPASAKLPPVGFDHPKVTAAFTCQPDGSRTVVWTIQNFTHLTAMTISSWATTPDATTPLSTIIPTPLGTTTASGAVAAGVTIEHASLTADWPTGREAIVDIDAPVPTCTPQPTTTTTGVTTTTTGATTTTEGPVRGQGAPASTTPPTVTTGAMPATGAASGALVGLGIGLAGCGGLLVGAARRRRTV